MKARTYVSIVDPPDVEPVLAPAAHGGQAAGVISLATARDLIKEPEAGVKAAWKVGPP